jgi:hypothetical protein
MFFFIKIISFAKSAYPIMAASKIIKIVGNSTGKGADCFHFVSLAEL